MLCMTDEADPAVALLEDPTMMPVLALCDAEETEPAKADKEVSPRTWGDLVETGPAILFDAREADDEEDEEEEEEDEDFFDDEEEEEDDLDDDLEEDDFEEEEFEEDEEEEEEEDDEEL